MAVSYKKLWKLLIDKDMMKKELAQKANVSNYTLAKMNKGENVTTDVLVRICKALECNLDDIMELIYKGFDVAQIARALRSDINLVALKVAELNSRGHSFRPQEYKNTFLK